MKIIQTHTLFRFILIPAKAGICLSLVLILTSQAFADTTFVSGAVSGEWTRDGNPYIVEDSTWVPEGEWLTLTAGVEAFFNEGQGLYVFGIMNAEGRERDSVRIRVAEGVRHWKGVRFFGRNRTQWGYGSIVCPDVAFALDPSCTFTFNNSLLDATRPIAGNTRTEIRSSNLTFINSLMRSASGHIATGGQVIANHTTFDFGSDEGLDPGFWTPGTRYVLTSCTVIGAIHAEEGVVYADSCRFLRTPLGRPTGVGISNGRMTETYVEGGVGAGRMDSRVPVTFRNNTVDHLGISGTVNVTECNIRGLLTIDFGERVTVQNSTINFGPWISNSNVVAMDSCLCFNNGGQRDFISVDATSSLAVTRSLLDCWIAFGSYDDIGEVIFDHNTIIPYMDTTRRFEGISAPAEIVWTNNIFIHPFAVPESQLFSSTNFYNAKFNCIYGFEYAGSEDNNANYIYFPIEDIDSTNVIADPHLVWEEFDPYLAEDSPCIDAGDPNALPDPDRTRTDIGVNFFNQNNAVIEPSIQFHPENLVVGCFPNPFNNSLSIAISSAKSAPKSITLIDRLGRTVYYSELTPSSLPILSITFNTGSLPSGTYFIAVKSARSLSSVQVNCLK